MKRLLNYHEEAANDRLKRLCDHWDAHVFPKVRLADVLSIEHSGIEDVLYRFALQSHFDFVVTDGDLQALFAVEFDGEMHRVPEQRERDAKKNRLADRFVLPLLRINSRYLVRRYRDVDLLGWFIHTWFATQLMEGAQAKGQMPPDEPIDATFVYNLPGEDNSFPLWLTSDIQERVRALADARRCYDPGISYVVSQDKDENYHALGFIRMSPNTAVRARTGMRNQLFPVDTSALLGDIVTFDTYDAIGRVLGGEEPPITTFELEAQVRAFDEEYSCRCSTNFGRMTPVDWPAQ